MENHEKESELYNKFQSALGPAQKLLYLKELILLYKQEGPSERVNEAYLEALHKSLEISNADPALWFEFGEAAFSLERLPLALYAFRAACSLSQNASYLYSYSLTLALTHDYINALAVANYLLDTFDYKEAQKVKDLVKLRLTGEGFSDIPRSKTSKMAEDEEEVGVKKVWNLYSLCVAVRLLAFNQDGKLYIFEKGEQGAGKKKKSDKFVAPDCKYWELIEKYKTKILQKTGSACFGFIPEKILNPSFITSKVSSLCESEVYRFFNIPQNYRKLSSELLNLLCKNNPRPSVLLSGEVSSEVLRIYSLTKEFLSLQDEYLTLLEIAIKEAPELIIDLRTKLINTYNLTDTLNTRCYWALALSYFRTRDTLDKYQGTRPQQLYNAYVYAEKVLNLVLNETLYLWWSDSFICKNEIQNLMQEILLDNECLEMEKYLKTGIRLAQGTLSLLDKLTRILTRLHTLEDPQYYWKKIKLILKNIHKFQLTSEQYETLALCMSRYIAVLLYTLENGAKVNNDHDIKGLLKILTENINYSLLKPDTQCQIIVSTINLLRHCSKNFTQIPFLFKTVFKHLDPEFLPKVFQDFHNILPKIDESKVDKNKQKIKSIDTKFHISLCKEFERSCSMNKSENQEVIYKWIYGLGSKKCECKLFFPAAAPMLPNSSNKLLRIVNYLDINWVLSVEIPSDSKVLAFFNELYVKEPKFFVTCKLEGLKKLEELLVLTSVHTNCCSESAREVAKKAYKRFGIELISTGIKTEGKEACKHLRNAIDILINGLSLDTSDYEIWALLGLAHMWRWVLGCYDLLHTVDQVQTGEDQVQLGLQCFDKAITSTNEDLQVYCMESKATLLYWLSDSDKSKTKYCIENLPASLTKKIKTIQLLLLSKTEKNLKLIEFPLKHPVINWVNYKALGYDEYLKNLVDSEDVIAKYYEGKIKKNWLELFEKGFLTLGLPCQKMKIHRLGQLWKIRRKFGEKCLEMCKLTKNIEKLQEVITKMSGLCLRSKKNKEILKFISSGVKILCFDLEKPDLARQEIDKNGVLNTKEKQSLRSELFPVVN